MSALTPERPRDLPSPFYRVATRAIVIDERQRLLVVVNHDGDHELPGGGWEHDESFADCLRRETREELGVELLDFEPAILCAYRGRDAYNDVALRLAVRARLESYDFRPVDMAEVKWVTRDEFMDIDFIPTAEEGLKEHVDLIWPA